MQGHNFFPKWHLTNILTQNFLNASLDSVFHILSTCNKFWTFMAQVFGIKFQWRYEFPSNFVWIVESLLRWKKQPSSQYLSLLSCPRGVYRRQQIENLHSVGSWSYNLFTLFNLLVFDTLVRIYWLPTDRTKVIFVWATSFDFKVRQIICSMIKERSPFLNV